MTAAAAALAAATAAGGADEGWKLITAAMMGRQMIDR